MFVQWKSGALSGLVKSDLCWLNHSERKQKTDTLGDRGRIGSVVTRQGSLCSENNQSGSCGISYKAPSQNSGQAAVRLLSSHTQYNSGRGVVHFHSL